MNELAGIFTSVFKDFTPGAYGIWLGVGMLAIYYMREWRETRKLSADDRIARRDGYAKQVEMLLTENRAQREEMHQWRKEHDAYRALCHQETEQLRTQILRLEDQVTGLERLRAVDAVELLKLKRTVDHDRDEASSL